MGAFPSVAVYIAFNVLLNVALAVRVIRLSGATRTSRGGGGDPALEWALRAHGNNAEYAPFALASLIFMALLDAPPVIVHATGLSYTVGRCLMAWVLGWNEGRGRVHQVGMALTFLALVTAAIALLVLASEVGT